MPVTYGEVTAAGCAAVVVDDVLDHDQLGRLVIVGDRTGLASVPA